MLFGLYFFVMLGKKLHLSGKEGAVERYCRWELAQVLPILRVLAKQCRVCLKYPILNTLEATARMFMINQIEALFFVYLTRSTDWNVDDEIIRAHSAQIKDLFNFSYETQEYKNLILYLTLISYSLKSCLSDANDLFLGEAIKICPAFPAAFEKWSNKYGELIRKINPKDINRLYRSVVLERGKVEVDYIAVVDQILEISLPYSVTRNEEKLISREELKREAQCALQGLGLPSKKMKLQQNPQNSLQATFSDHALKSLLELATTTNDDEVESQGRINELGIEMGVRPLMIMPDTIINPDEDYYQEINLENESLSGQKFVLREFMETFEPSNLGHGSTRDFRDKLFFESDEEQ